MLRNAPQRLQAAVENYLGLLTASRNLDFFTSFYRYFIQLLPAAVVAPLFFQVRGVPPGADTCAHLLVFTAQLLVCCSATEVTSFPGPCAWDQRHSLSSRELGCLPLAHWAPSLESFGTLFTFASSLRHGANACPPAFSCLPSHPTGQDRLRCDQPEPVRLQPHPERRLPGHLPDRSASRCGCVPR